MKFPSRTTVGLSSDSRTGRTTYRGTRSEDSEAFSAAIASACFALLALALGAAALLGWIR